MSNAPKMAPAINVKEAEKTISRVSERRSARSNEAEKTNPFAAVKDNVFFLAVTNQEASEEQKQQIVGGLMTTQKDRKKDRANVRQYEEFREWLAHQARDLAKEVIALTDPETMTEVQDMIDQLAGGLLDFNEGMGPLLQIVDAIFQLRNDRLIETAYEDIKKRERFEAETAAQKDAKSKSLAALRADMDKVRDDNIVLSQKRTLFGMSGPSQADRTEIARNEARLEDMRSKLAKEEQDLVALDSASYTSEIDPKHAENVQKLRGLLDLSREENKAQIIRVRDSATDFINKADERTFSLTKRFQGMTDQTDKVHDGNSSMSRIYHTLHEGLRIAENNNHQIRSELAIGPVDESQIAKMQRDETLRIVDSHIGMVQNSSADTLATFADLHQQSIRIETMRGGITQQMDLARKLNTQGVAATADRLAMSLTAFNSAALGEANAVANDILQSMRESTNAITSNEAIRVASGVQDVTDKLGLIVDEMADLSEITRQSTEIARRGTEEMNDRMAEMRERSATLRADLQNRMGVVSDVRSGTTDGGRSATDKTDDAAPSIFG